MTGKEVNEPQRNWQEETVVFHVGPEEQTRRARKVLREVFQALQEKGYDPISQLVGYLLSGDPTYITSHAGARQLVRTVERDELLEELLRAFIKQEQAG